MSATVCNKLPSAPLLQLPLAVELGGLLQLWQDELGWTLGTQSRVGLLPRRCDRSRHPHSADFPASCLASRFLSAAQGSLGESQSQPHERCQTRPDRTVDFPPLDHSTRLDLANYECAYAIVHCYARMILVLLFSDSY